MDASTRNAIMRKKRAMQAKQPIASMDIGGIREATRLKFKELLSPAKNSTKLAKALDKALEAKYKAHTPEYKNAFRRLYICLKNNNAGFKEELISGKLTPDAFASMSAEELKSSKQQLEEKTMKEEAMKKSIAQELLPENVNQIKDGRDREKWGVSRSAAAIDD